MRILKAAMTVGGFTAVSRVFGLVREMMISHLLGASIVTDAFFVAFKFPNFFRRIFAEGAFNASFVPLFSHTLVSEGEAAAKGMAEKIFAALAFVLTIFVALVVLFTPSIIHILAPGFATTPERFELAVTYTQITFPYILFISLTAHLSGVLNSLDRFATAAGVPVLLNIVMIAALLMAPKWGVSYGIALSVSVCVAGVLQLLWVYFACVRAGFRIHLRLPTFSPEVRKLCRLMIPGVIGAGVMNINLFIDTILASFLPAKSISFLFYADRLNQFPLSILGIAMGTALLPSLSRQLKAGDYEKAYHSKKLAIEFAIQLTLPAALGLMLLSYPMIHVIYGLSVSDTQAIASALAAFAAGIPAYVLTKIFAASFFARQDTKTPVKIGCLCIAINLILNLVLMQFFAHVGLALATSLAAWVNASLLYAGLKRRHWFRLTPAFWILTGKVVIATAAMGLGLWAFALVGSDMLNHGVGLEVFYIFLSVMVGLAVYAVFSVSFKLINLTKIKQALLRR
ncbi:murein biosynthesis integral membrane protein MurJ [Candidatus Paracaedibacter symbiosus]|uniref:murein biosynthesis integral membrane protein MurJ n=1 Tax=Candidatus Paracaedibacter symbiosus TaxID=244582 RepID=UPI000509CC51|nr:murein biosynthesis integral membrane protein MurJ [Candidatus Paracaedibacter symbiosus]